MLYDASGQEITEGIRPISSTKNYPPSLQKPVPAHFKSFAFAIPGDSIDNLTLAKRHGLVVPERDLPQGNDFHNWVYKRTGISSRHHVETPITGFAFDAALQAIKVAEIRPQEIGCIIFGTTDSRNETAGVAEQICSKLVCKENMPIRYVNNACSSLVYCVEEAIGEIKKNEELGHVLVVCADKNSDVINFNDVGTAVLFGDGAAATVVSKGQGKDSNFPSGVCSESMFTGSDLNLKDLVYLDDNHQMRMPNGPKVFVNAVTAVKKSIRQSLERAEVAIQDIDHFFLHQANVKLVKSVAHAMEIPKGKIYSNIGEIGNTGAASPLILASEAVELGVARKGDIALFSAVGIGMRWGAFIAVL